MRPSESPRKSALSTLMAAIEVHNDPKALTDPDALLPSSTAANRSARLLLLPAADDPILGRARHDLKAAIRTIGSAISALKAGYTFQDDSRAAKIDAMVRAHEALMEGNALLLKLLDDFAAKK